MDCPFPRSIPERGLVPCGKCLVCLKRKQDDWIFRLSQEMKVSTNVYFITFTYDEFSVPRCGSYNVLCKRDMQLFLKKLRFKISPHRIRYFVCGEYGPKTFRPHYHMILFNWSSDYDIWKVLPSCWSKGFTSVKPVHPNHIRYVAKYCNMSADLPSFLRKKQFRPFLLCSRRPAIGLSYLSSDMVDYYRQGLSTVCRLNGYRQSLPKYYRDKLFDDDMKAQISDRINKFRYEKEIKKWREGTPDIRYVRGSVDTESYSEYRRIARDGLFKSSKL